MFSRRAQTTTEALLVLSMAVFLLIFFLSTAYNQIYNNTVLEQQKIGSAAVKALAKEVDDAYFLGAGTVKNVYIKMPRLVDYEYSYISGKSIVLRVEQNDYISSTKVDVRGTWPDQSGVSVFSIHAYGDFVTLADQPVFFSPAQLNITVLQGASSDINISITNISDSAKDYNFYSEFPSTGSGASLSTTSLNPITIDSNSTSTISLTFSCSSDAFGNYDGKVVFVPSNSTDANISVPIKLACNYAKDRLVLSPIGKTISVSASSTATSSILVCNNSSLAFKEVEAHLEGSAAAYIFTNFFEDVSADSCSTIPLSISAPASAGTYDGNITVSSSGYSSTAAISLVVS
ncbi:Uncharacterised protein [uncultured archaeon]|nr:Uncharacterised protein [uncultured archaeon]